MLLTLVATTLAKPVAKFAAGVVDTNGNFPTGVIDTGGAPWLANISANFQKVRNAPNGILWGWGETDSWKKTEAKRSRVVYTYYIEVVLWICLGWVIYHGMVHN
jgi:hypothetical protein